MGKGKKDDNDRQGGQDPGAGESGGSRTDRGDQGGTADGAGGHP